MSLVDQFGSVTRTIAEPVRLCAPTNLYDQDPTAPSHADHLEGYKLQRPTGAPQFATIPNQKVANQFGTLFVDVKKPQVLMFPTAKSLISSPPALIAPAIDLFECHKVSRTPNTPAFVHVPAVSVQPVQHLHDRCEEPEDAVRTRQQGQ